MSQPVSVIEQAWKLRQRGQNQTEIAAAVGVDQGTVSRWLRKLERRELERLSRRIGREKVRQTVVLETILEQAMDAWEESKKPLRWTRKSRGVEQVTVEDRNGDPRYLDAAMKALSAIRDVWGLNAAPARPGSDGPEELTYAALAERLKERAGEG